MNVYLDVAQLLGPPFTWQKFDRACAENRDMPVPNIIEPRVDSLKALALAQSGRFAGKERLQVWTSDHIDNLVFFKATQSPAGERAEDRGLGWREEDAATLLDVLVWDLVEHHSEGGWCTQVAIPYGSPPLDHEDGVVYRTAEQCSGANAVRYLVTNDRKFRTADLPGDITLLLAHEWVQLIRASRFALEAPPRPKPAA